MSENDEQKMKESVSSDSSVKGSPVEDKLPLWTELLNMPEDGEQKIQEQVEDNLINNIRVENGPKTKNLAKLHWWTVFLAACGIFLGLGTLYTTWQGGDWATNYGNRTTGEVWSQQPGKGPITNDQTTLLILTIASLVSLMIGIGLLCRQIWAWYTAIIFLTVLCIMTLYRNFGIAAILTAAWTYGVIKDAPAFFDPLPEWLSWIRKQSEHVCTGCGERTKQNATFCPKCGKQTGA